MRDEMGVENKAVGNRAVVEAVDAAWRCDVMKRRPNDGVPQVTYRILLRVK